MHLNELKRKSPTELLSMAAEQGIENLNNMRKQELANCFTEAQMKFVSLIRRSVIPMIAFWSDTNDSSVSPIGPVRIDLRTAFV